MNYNCKESRKMPNVFPTKQTKERLVKNLPEENNAKTFGKSEKKLTKNLASLNSQPKKSWQMSKEKW